LNSRCSELQDGVLMADSLHDVDARFRQMDEIGGFPHVIMSSNPPLEEMDSPEQGAEAARIVNDALAETQHAHPDRFPAFAGSLALHNVEASVDEVHRLMRDLGAKGVQLNTNATGLALDDPRFAPVFDALHEEDATIWMHPQRTHLTKDYEGEEFARYATWASMGWPCATTVAMIRMAATGMFDRYPGMRVITHHLGGMIPFFEGRVDGGLQVLGARTTDEDYSTVLSSLKKPHSEYFKMFYGDTAMFGAHIGTRCGIEYFGADHVVFASDAPVGGPTQNAFQAIDRLELDDAVRNRICFENAERLMKISLG
ncbi:MAG: amidohydrolase family protein, partial [Rhodospirillales bacterium]|nr:amidohydrolase family protein [Rhodospirillales bacterium]